MTMATTRTARAVPRFLIPSLIGVALFMMPVPSPDGSITIPVAILADTAGSLLSGIMPYLMVGLMAVSAAGTAVHLLFAPAFMERSATLRTLFRSTVSWLVIRVVGLIVGAMTLWQIGPRWLWGEDTGQVIFDLAALLVTVFFFAGLLLPLLLNFGLIEFAGALMNKIMRPLFTVPGRSSIDSLASWFGDAIIGVLMTSQQYEHGHYTRREAAVLGTTFNVVSLTFTIVVMRQLDLEHMFLGFYGTIVVAGLVAAMIMPRIPPLSRFPDVYIDGTPRRAQDDAEEQGALLRRAWQGALDRASIALPGETVKRGLTNVLEMWIGVLPVIMAVGTLAVVVAEHTPVFTWLGTPFVPVLEAMQVPEAKAASETMLIGFTDMLLPSVIAMDITSEMTRFIIGCLSITQLIYMSEVGGMLLASSLPVKLRHLVMVFLERTVITLPVIVICAHILY